MVYYARIRFNILSATFINFDTKTKVLFENKDAICKLSGYNDTIKDSEKLFIEYGPFISYDEAFSKGKSLLFELKLYCAKRRISIKISGEPGETDSVNLSTQVNGITPEGIEGFGFHINTLPDVLGLQIYETDSDMSVFPFLISSLNGESFLSNFSLTGEEMSFLDDKVQTALSLLNSSNVLNRDSRVSFLLKVMAVETLVAEEQKKDVEILLILEDIISKTDNLEIRNAIGNLKNKSIGQKCKEIVVKYAKNKFFNDMNAEKFWSKVYNYRSKFVHKGTLNIDNIREIETAFNELVLTIIEGYIYDLNEYLHS